MSREFPKSSRQLFDPGCSTVNNETGFGLVIIEQIAEAHGYTVETVADTDGSARIEVTCAF